MYNLNEMRKIFSNPRKIYTSSNASDTMESNKESKKDILSETIMAKDMSPSK